MHTYNQPRHKPWAEWKGQDDAFSETNQKKYNETFKDLIKTSFFLTN